MPAVPNAAPASPPKAAAPAAMTLRLDPRLKDQLSKLGELRHMPMSRLINQALAKFVAEETLLIQAELEASLADLRTYLREDPDFERAIEAAAAAEVSAGAAGLEDPAQGTVATPSESLEAGETTRLVRSLLNV